MNNRLSAPDPEAVLTMVPSTPAETDAVVAQLRTMVSWNAASDNGLSPTDFLGDEQIAVFAKRAETAAARLVLLAA